MFLRLPLLKVLLLSLLFVGVVSLPLAYGHEGVRSAPRRIESPVFQQYGLISAELENAILDNYAIQLLNDPELTGTVILRRGQYSREFAAKRLLRIKNYLLQRRRVPTIRISSFQVQRGKDFTVELYLSSKAKRGSAQDYDLR